MNHDFIAGIVTWGVITGLWFLSVFLIISSAITNNPLTNLVMGVVVAAIALRVGAIVLGKEEK